MSCTLLPLTAQDCIGAITPDRTVCKWSVRIFAKIFKSVFTIIKWRKLLISRQFREHFIRKTIDSRCLVRPDCRQCWRHFVLCNVPLTPSHTQGKWSRQDRRRTEHSSLQAPWRKVSESIRETPCSFVDRRCLFGDVALVIFHCEASLNFSARRRWFLFVALQDILFNLALNTRSCYCQLCHSYVSFYTIFCFDSPINFRFFWGR